MNATETTPSTLPVDGAGEAANLPASSAPLVESALDNGEAGALRDVVRHLETALRLIATLEFAKRGTRAKLSGRDAQRAVTIAREALTEFYEAKELIG